MTQKFVLESDYKPTGDQPTAIRQLIAGLSSGLKELTLLGVTRPLTLTISRVVCAPHPFYKKEDCGAEVTGTLKRSDFGMKKYVPAVGDEVTLHIQVESIKE